MHFIKLGTMSGLVFSGAQWLRLPMLEDRYAPVEIDVSKFGNRRPLALIDTAAGSPD